jgi:hypothetical protein
MSRDANSRIGDRDVDHALHARLLGGRDEPAAVLDRAREGGPAVVEPDPVGVVEDLHVGERLAQARRVVEVEGPNLHATSERIRSVEVSGE